MQSEKQTHPTIPVKVTINIGVFQDGEVYDSLRDMYKQIDPDFDERARYTVITNKIYKNEQLHKD